MAQKTDNRSVGGRFEQELARKLADAGFWVHVLQQNKAGQPADIIVATGDYHTLIDCKDVRSGNSFRLSRVEENQKHAMWRFQKLADHFCWFAVQFSDGEVYMLRYDFVAKLIHDGESSISRKTMDELIDDWFVYKIDDWVDCVGANVER